MAKTEISGKHKRSARKSSKPTLIPHRPHSSSELKTLKAVSEALVDCLSTGDLDTFREVLAAHILTMNKSRLAVQSGLGRRTIYDLLDPQKEFNPSIQTVSSLLRALAS